MKRSIVTLGCSLSLFLMSSFTKPWTVKANELTEQATEKTAHFMKEYARYNLWANERYVEWLMQATDEQMTREVESSFNSLRKTVAHLWNAEYGWLRTLKELPWGTAPANEFQGSTKEFLEAFLETSREFVGYVESLSEDDFKKAYTFSSSDKTTTAEQIMLHVFNHATYHRGQLITMGRQIGLKNPPRADFIYYVRK